MKAILIQNIKKKSMKAIDFYFKDNKHQSAITLIYFTEKN